jgi:hypothetical protein
VDTSFIRQHRPYYRNDDRDRRDYRCDYRNDGRRDDYRLNDHTKITATTGVTTDVMTTVKSNVTIGVMIDVARTTTTAKTTTRSALHHHHHHLKGATPMVRSKQPTSSSAVAKQPKATGNSDQKQGRSGTSTLILRNLYIG